jgi:hypothetical protein
VRLGHDRDDRDPARGADGLRAQAREQRLAVLVGDGADELDKLGGFAQALLSRTPFLTALRLIQRPVAERRRL